jgi:hypothetical protein
MSLYHDVIEALTPLVDAFDRLGITYYIGGSVSSSLHGLARQSQDVDVMNPRMNGGGLQYPHGTRVGQEHDQSRP